MDQRIIDLYNEYTHAALDRRVFMRRLSALAGGSAAAAALLPLLQVNRAKAAIVAPDDDRLVTERVTYPGASGELEAYLVKPDGDGPWPGVVVVHENRGLNGHIEDVARRIALEGFVALAPDALSPHGGTPEDYDQAREMIRELDLEVTVADYARAVSYLKGRADTTGRVGTVGFCWGGGVVGRLAAVADDLEAAVVFYGPVPPLELVPAIEVPLLLHYAGLDERINVDVPDFEAALQEAGVDYTLHMYEGTNHAFHNDASELRYDPEAAALAFERTIAFFNEHLRG